MITPFRRIWHWPRLTLTRRRIGLAALAYAAGHFLLYALDQEFVVSKIASEIALRVYLLIGFIGLIGLIALGATSWDGAVKRIGAENWNRLHKTAYVIAGLATLHFFMQSKLDVTEPTLMWGLFLWAMGWRALQRSGERAVSLVWLTALAVAAGLLTALSEALWYGLATGVDPVRVLKANFTVVLGLRPCWQVLIFGLIAAATSLIGAKRAGAGARDRSGDGQRGTATVARLYQHPLRSLRSASRSRRRLECPTIFFFDLKGTASRSEVQAYFRSNPHYEVDENTGSIIYSNDDTGVYSYSIKTILTEAI